jgi:hypothetical protein
MVMATKLNNIVVFVIQAVIKSVTWGRFDFIFSSGTKNNFTN